MRTKRLLTTALLLALVATSAAAKPPSEPSPWPLYVLDTAPLPQGSQPLLPDAAEEFLIEVDPEEVAANPQSFLIDLPGHAFLEAVRTRFVDNQPDWKSWFGTLRYAGGGVVGSIHIGYHGAQITALIELDEGDHYQIASGVEGRHRLIRLDMAKAPRSCGLETSNAAVEVPFRGTGPRLSSAPLFEPCTTNARIDLLVVYPSRGKTKPGFFELSQYEESELFRFVKDSVDRANEVFRNNGLGAYYNLVSDPVPLLSQDLSNYLPSFTVEWVLDWMNQEHLELISLRQDFGADVVAVYIPFGWNSSDPSCGFANLRRSESEIEIPFGRVGPFSDRAFSAHRDGCGLADYTLAHEIGHNYGMRHHDQDPKVLPSAYPYARGFEFFDSNGVQRFTVMSGCTAAPCKRIPAFSDPTRKYDATITPPNNPINLYNGKSIGDDDHNNALVACKQIGVYSDQPGTYSGLKAQSSNIRPTAKFAVSCSRLTCTFNASSSTDDKPLESNSYWWDFGDKSEVKPDANVVTHTYVNPGYYRVHLVVKDSGGQTDVEWGMANPTNPPIYEGYHDIATCRDIYGWAWDQTKPNTPINVDVYRDGAYVATVSAGLFRQDLLNAGKGNGYHGFNYVPSGSAWRDGRWHTPLVRFGGTSTNLTGSPPNNIICNACILCGLTPVDTLATGGPFTVGTQLSSSVGGRIVQLGFYRASGEAGTNTLRLWTDSGSLLASATPTCSSSGWCWASISPVTITAGTRYRVGVTVNTSYVKTGCGIGGGYTKDPLTAHSGYWIAGNAFPTGGSCSNFFVDVKFDI